MARTPVADRVATRRAPLGDRVLAREPLPLPPQPRAVGRVICGPARLSGKPRELLAGGDLLEAILAQLLGGKVR